VTLTYKLNLLDLFYFFNLNQLILEERHFFAIFITRWHLRLIFLLPDKNNAEERVL
jgi:hypothetical protein